MTIAFVIIAGFMVLLVFGAPISFALGVAAVVGYLWVGGLSNLVQLPIIGYQMIDSSVFLALPLFILMGTILLHGKVGADFFNLAAAFFGHRRAGLAIATIVACAIFSAISASSLATAATIGALSVPSMLRQGYPARLVYGPVAAGGTLGILIPPSGVMILFGAMTDVSIGDLFTAGIIPGLMLTTMLCLCAVIVSRRADMIPLPRSTWPERWTAIRQSSWGLTLPVIVLGGLYSGLFTPNEAGAVGVLASFLITMAVKRTITFETLPRVLLEGTKTAGFLFGVIIAAGIFNHVMTELRFISEFTDWVISMGTGRTTTIVMITLLIVVMGMFFEVAALVLIMVPILFPIILAMGIDPLWFGIYFVVAVEFAYLTPPVGMNLFIIQDIGRRYTRTSLIDVMKSVSPYLVAHIIMLLLLIFVPQIATVLVR